MSAEPAQPQAGYFDHLVRALDEAAAAEQLAQASEGAGTRQAVLALVGAANAQTYALVDIGISLRRLANRYAPPTEAPPT